MDAKLYFACSVVAVELLRLFRPAPPPLHHSPTRSTTDTVAKSSEAEVAQLVKSLAVLPHPEGE